MQKFSFQSMENSRIQIAADRTTADVEDPDHWDKLPQNTRVASAAGKASSSRHSTQDRSEGDSDEEILMYYDPTPLAYAFPPTPFAYPIPSSAIPDDEVIDATPLSQGPPPAGILMEIGGGKLTLRRGISLAWRLLWLGEKRGMREGNLGIK
jgi:hypothetical protein